MSPLIGDHGPCLHLVLKMKRQGVGNYLYAFPLPLYLSVRAVRRSRENYRVRVNFLYVRILGPREDEGQMNISLVRSPRRLQVVVYDRSSG